MTLAWPWMLLCAPLPWLLRRWLPGGDDAIALRVPSIADLAVRGTGADRSSHEPGAASPSRSIPWLAAGAWLLLVLAAARPVAPAGPQQLAMSGRDLVIALDVSASMGTRDLNLGGVPVERLHAARELARDFVRRRDGDRIGLVVFGSQAYLHTPLTWDREAVDAMLADARVGLAGRETAIGDAVALAVRRMRELSDGAKVLVLLTDGANTAGALTPAQAGWLARREGVRIHAVGIGTAEPPAAEQTDRSGTVLDEDALRALAEQTGGTYRRAIDAAGLAAFYGEVEALEPAGGIDAVVRPVRELYPWPLATALAFVGLLGLARGRMRGTAR